MSREEYVEIPHRSPPTAHQRTGHHCDETRQRKQQVVEYAQYNADYYAEYFVEMLRCKSGPDYK